MPSASPITRFVIPFLPRSGSNYLVSRLLYSQQILLAWEPFNPLVDRWFDETPLLAKQSAASRRALQNLPLRNASPHEFYDKSFSPKSRLRLSGVRAVGFKIAPEHQPEVFWRAVAEPDIKVLLLQRRNHLATYSSRMIALATGRYIHGEGDQPRKVFFDKDAFDTYVHFVDAIFAGVRHHLRGKERSVLEIDYEDLTSGTYDMGRIADFLGLQPFDGASWLRRQNEQNLLERFTNPEDVMRHIKDRHPTCLPV